MLVIPDAASVATIWWLESVMGRKCGGSTGTNVCGALQIVAEMLKAGESGSVVTMICDPGERYLGTYYNDDWIRGENLELEPHIQRLKRFSTSGQLALG